MTSFKQPSNVNFSMCHAEIKTKDRSLSRQQWFNWVIRMCERRSLSNQWLMNKPARQSRWPFGKRTGTKMTGHCWLINPLSLQDRCWQLRAWTPFSCRHGDALSERTSSRHHRNMPLVFNFMPLLRVTGWMISSLSQDSTKSGWQQKTIRADWIWHGVWFGLKGQLLTSTAWHPRPIDVQVWSKIENHMDSDLPKKTMKLPGKSYILIVRFPKHMMFSTCSRFNHFRMDAVLACLNSGANILSGSSRQSKL